MNAAVLEMRDVAIGYKRETVAANINLSARAGELISIAGRNGCGKSTLLKTIMRIIPPLQGEIFLQGKSLRRYAPSEMSRLASVALTDALPPSRLTLCELTALGRHSYTNWIDALTAADKDKIDQALALTGIFDIRHKCHTDVSDGQLQKALIARAIAQDTPLILLDEPTSHLDIVFKVNLFRLVKRLCREQNKCVVLSTHDIELALAFSDRILAMTPEGAFVGAPEALIEQKIIDKIFAGEHARFDPDTKRFLLA